MKTQIFAVTHGDNRTVAGSDCIPVMAGAALGHGQLPEGYLRDDTGLNISEKNRGFCELTAMYWIWKNTENDIAGLCHYRRYFASSQRKEQIITNEEAEHLLKYYEVLLPKARNYYFETNYTQYAHAHHAADLDITRAIIAERHPEYLDEFDKCMGVRSGHRFNMLIARRPLFDEYCEWLFDILFELEKRLDISDYSDRDRRVYGFTAERLMDVWVKTKGLRTAETDYVFTGREHMAAKAAGMLIRKAKAYIAETRGKL